MSTFACLLPAFPPMPHDYSPLVPPPPPDHAHQQLDTRPYREALPGQHAPAPDTHAGPLSPAASLPSGSRPPLSPSTVLSISAAAVDWLDDFLRRDVEAVRQYSMWQQAGMPGLQWQLQQQQGMPSAYQVQQQQQQLGGQQ